MNAALSGQVLVAFLLAALRAGAWLTVSPPFNTKAVPGTVRAGLSAAVALPVALRLSSSAPPSDVGSLVGAAVSQVAVGLALGFLTLVVMSTLQAAGDLIDLFGGFSVAQAYDPLSLTTTSVFGRLHNLLMVTLLFALNGHLLLLRGFLTSYDVVPLDGIPRIGGLVDLAVHGVTGLLVSALEVASPLIAASFLADLALGLLSRVAPSLNVLNLGFPVKILLTLALVGFTLPLLPHTVGLLVDRAVQAMAGSG